MSDTPPFLYGVPLRFRRGEAVGRRRGDCIDTLGSLTNEKIEKSRPIPRSTGRVSYGMTSFVEEGSDLRRDGNEK